MSYTTQDAHDDALSDATNDFLDNLDRLARSLIRENCAADYQDDVMEMVDNTDDIAWTFLRNAFNRQCDRSSENAS